MCLPFIPFYKQVQSASSTSKALSWAFYHLARDQQLQKILADEVKDLPEEVSPQHLAPWICAQRRFGFTKRFKQQTSCS